MRKAVTKTASQSNIAGDSSIGMRRRFLTGAAAATAGAATLGFPTIAKAQGPITMRWQSTWPAKDP